MTTETHERKIEITESDGVKGVKSFLTTVAAGVCVVIVSGSICATAKALMDEARIEERIENIKAEQQVQAAKMATVPETLAALTVSMGNVQAQLTAVNAKLEKLDSPRR